MALKCRACRECNGIACRGEIPGVGGKGTGSSFIHNVEALARIRINMDVCAEPSEISTEAELLGMKLSMPVFAAPCAGIQNNYGDDISEYDYSCQLLDACESLGIRGFTVMELIRSICFRSLPRPSMTIMAMASSRSSHGFRKGLKNGFICWRDYPLKQLPWISMRPDSRY